MADETDDGSLLRKLRKQFESYATAKADEIDEQRNAWRYYHSLQLTDAQKKVLKGRGQPQIIFDRLSRKMDGLIGTIRRLRTDPKAFPRTPNQEEGAEVATQVIRTICDQSDFESIEAECGRDAAVAGIGVSEKILTTGDHGDPDILFGYVDPRTYFYDPRSVRPNFDDRRFDGVYKWADKDEIEELIPGASEKLSQAGDDGSFFTAFDSDREILWLDEKNRYRLVDHWYIEGGMWRSCLHVGSVLLAKSDSPFFDRLGKSRPKFNAFANLIDGEGVHYGYIRRLKGPQDAMNQHRSKALHIMNTRQLKIRKGIFDNIETLRKEAARADGVLEWLNDPAEIEVIDGAQEFLKQTQYYEDAKQEIETFGPNPALLGDMGQSASGRAYAMAQQAGLAELGPFLKNYRMWKLDQYQDGWCAAQRYWTSERFLRVTDDEELAKFLQVNGTGFDQYGQPALVNVLGAIDVDIVISEGPDTETVMGDVFDLLSSMANSKMPIPPTVMIEASNLPGSEKRRLTKLMNQPDPAKQQAAQLELQGKAAENQETQSRTMLNMAKARAEGIPDAAPMQQEYEVPPDLQNMQAMADIAETRASTLEKLAKADKTRTESAMMPRQMVMDAENAAADRRVAQQRQRAVR